MKKYSQNEEELFIVDYFSYKPLGKFMDIGGYDPFVFSNTRKLYEMGWKGIIVEPSPLCFKAFVKEYENNESIVLINKAVSDENGMMTFYESNGDAVGTSDIDHMKLWTGGGINYSEMKVPTISMTSLLANYGDNVKFLSLDTEATNIKLFDMLPDWFLKQIDMICIEHDGKFEYIIDKLQPFGFSVLYQNQENVICGKI